MARDLHWTSIRYLRSHIQTRSTASATPHLFAHHIGIQGQVLHLILFYLSTFPSFSVVLPIVYVVALLLFGLNFS